MNSKTFILFTVACLEAFDVDLDSYTRPGFWKPAVLSHHKLKITCNTINIMVGTATETKTLPPKVVTFCILRFQIVLVLSFLPLAH